MVIPAKLKEAFIWAGLAVSVFAVAPVARGTHGADIVYRTAKDCSEKIKNGGACSEAETAALAQARAAENKNAPRWIFYKRHL